MIWYVTGACWVLTILFWGLGLTLLLLPRRWRRFWPAFCGPAGLGLQSLVVWIAAHTPLTGTDRYAWPAMLLPAGLLLAAGGRVPAGDALAGERRWGAFLAVTVAPLVAAIRRWAAGGRVPAGDALAGERRWEAVLAMMVAPLAAGIRRWAAVVALMAASLVVQCYPFTEPPGPLTSAAISSCDAADYAAGARMFKECSRDDNDGFLGTNGADPKLSTKRFFTFWLRINHFSPPALVAFHATLSGRQPHELVSLFAAVLFVLHLPSVCWLARSVFRFRPAGALGVTAIYASSPILYYTAYQTALSQLIAAPSVVWLTWTGWQAARGPATWRRLAAWSGMLLAGNWLLLGSYNFFILFAYIPVLTRVGIETLRHRRWARTARWLVLLAANLLLCTVFFRGRVVSIVERLRLFQATHFGWPIPGFWPTGWYGAFADVSTLTPTGSALAWAAAGAALAAAVGGGLRQAWRGRGQAALMAACWTLPIFCGYWLLLRAERLHNDRSSYDAFKLFTVFYPGILVSLCLWLRGRSAGPVGPAGPARLAAGGLWAILLAINLSGVGAFNALLARTPLVVEPELTAIAAVERLPDVPAVNINLPQVWDCLWANYFLLHKPQYILLPSYEGRPVSPPRARWDLSRRFLCAQLAGESDPLGTNATYTLTDRLSRLFVETRLGTGWYPLEQFHGQTWCWSRGQSQVLVSNPQSGKLTADLSFTVYANRERHLSVSAGPRTLWDGPIGRTAQTVDGVPLELPPGTTELRFTSPEPPEELPGDARALTFQLKRLVVNVRAAVP